MRWQMYGNSGVQNNFVSFAVKFKPSLEVVPVIFQSDGSELLNAFWSMPARAITSIQTYDFRLMTAVLQCWRLV